MNTKAAKKAPQGRTVVKKIRVPVDINRRREWRFELPLTAIVEGKLLPGGTVEANNLLLKCPSRYEEYKQEEIKVQAVQ